MNAYLTLPAEYAELPKEIKDLVRAARVRPSLAADRAKIIDRLSGDLHAAFPGPHGFSPRNLKYMHDFSDAWPDPRFVQ